MPKEEKMQEIAVILSLGKNKIKKILVIKHRFPGSILRP